MKTKTLLIFFVLFFFHLNAFATEPIDDILTKHGLISEKQEHRWKAFELHKNKYDLHSPDSRVTLINTVTAHIYKKNLHIDPSVDLKYRSVRTVLDKHGDIFQHIEDMLKSYDTVVRDMEHIHQKASLFYNTGTSGPEDAATKKDILKKVQTIYLSLRKSSIHIYEEGMKIESILKLIPDQLNKARKIESSDKVPGRQFADAYNINMLRQDGIKVEDELKESKDDINSVLKKNKTSFNEALRLLDHKF